jgi:hypothetical protein
MSLYLKGADGNHMITIGEEGFYGPGSAAEVVNPGTGWATITGQNFSANHAPDSIDFAAIHLWPDNWEVEPSPSPPVPSLPLPLPLPPPFLRPFTPFPFNFSICLDYMAHSMNLEDPLLLNPTPWPYPFLLN